MMPLSSGSASPSPLPSTVFTWDALPVQPTAAGERRAITDGPTATFRRFECHVTTLNGGLASHAPHRHPQEELILIKEGRFAISVNGHEQEAGPGSLVFFASGDLHAMRNAGETPGTYFVFMFFTGDTDTAGQSRMAAAPAPTGAQSRVIDWADLPVITTPKGFRREFFKSGTVTCRDFSVHATTLRGGEAAHAAHRHGDEEIIVVKDGTIETTINGRAHPAGPGSIFFFASHDEHGLRNAGATEGTYYVLRMITDQTPAD